MMNNNSVINIKTNLTHFDVSTTKIVPHLWVSGTNLLCPNRSSI